MLRLCGHTFHSQFQTVVRKRLAALTVASKELSSLAANNNNNNKEKKKEKNGDVNPNDDSSGSSISKRDDNGSSVEILYQRDPRRNGLPKASFLVSSMNSMYWLWYVFDFIPAVNASPIEDLHVDPIYGFGGLGLSILIQSVFTFYPLSLVSKIGYRASPAIAIATATADRSSTGSPDKKKRTLLSTNNGTFWCGSTRCHSCIPPRNHWFFLSVGLPWTRLRTTPERSSKNWEGTWANSKVTWV
mmetsp:Transcript_22002/g.61191  ORF Transcript_22002/g.61191 Transcript_22002/m.61191 type:complete len:244 (+) Transcript_22002:117-848(+)